MNRLQLRAEHSAQQFYNRRQIPTEEALAGDGVGNLNVAGRLQWIYVRMAGDSTKVSQAYNRSGFTFAENDSIALRWVKRTGMGFYQVDGYSGSAVYDVFGAGSGSGTGTGVAYHAWQHERMDAGTGGPDPLDIFARMVVPLRARAQTVPDLTMHVEAGYNPLTGNYYAGGNSAAFGPVPAVAGQARIDLLYLGSDDALHIVAGTPVGGGVTPTLPAVVVPSVPLAFVYLANAQTTIAEGNIYRDPGILRAPVGAVGAGVTSVSKGGSALLTGDVTLSEGANIVLTQAGNNIEIAANICAATLPVVGGGNPTIQVSGALAVVNGVGFYVVTGPVYVLAVYVYCDDPGSAGSTIVDVRKNGATIFPTIANRATLLFSDADGVAKSGLPDIPAAVENDVFAFDLTQVATGAADCAITLALAAVSVGCSATVVVVSPHSGTTDETVARAYVDGKVYWSSHRVDIGVGGGLGYEYYWDGAANNEYQSATGKAGWHSIHSIADGVIYVVGQVYADAIQFRAAVWTIDPATNTVTTHVLNTGGAATGDTNELIGFCDDVANNRLVAGERAGGGGVGGSSYPNGGGLWTIPKATIGTPATYTRVYEDTASPTREWHAIRMYGTDYYALLVDYTDGKYVIQHSANLTVWTVDVNGTALALNDIRGDLIYHRGQDKLYAATVNASRQLVLREYNGSAWSSTTFTDIVVPSAGTVVMFLAEYGNQLLLFVDRAAVFEHDIYTIDNLGGTPTATVRYAGLTGNIGGEFVVRWPDVWYGTAYPGGLNHIQ